MKQGSLRHGEHRKGDWKKSSGDCYSGNEKLSYRTVHVQNVMERILKLAQLKDQWVYPVLTSSAGTRSS